MYKSHQRKSLEIIQEKAHVFSLSLNHTRNGHIERITDNKSYLHYHRRLPDPDGVRLNKSPVWEYLCYDFKDNTHTLSFSSTINKTIYQTPLTHSLLAIAPIAFLFEKIYQKNNHISLT